MTYRFSGVLPLMKQLFFDNVNLVATDPSNDGNKIVTANASMLYNNPKQKTV
jgi:hypothetical protein